MTLTNIACDVTAPEAHTCTLITDTALSIRDTCKINTLRFEFPNQQDCWFDRFDCCWLLGMQLNRMIIKSIDYKMVCVDDIDLDTESRTWGHSRLTLSKSSTTRWWPMTGQVQRRPPCTPLGPGYSDKARGRRQGDKTRPSYFLRARRRRPYSHRHGQLRLHLQLRLNRCAVGSAVSRRRRRARTPGPSPSLAWQRSCCCSSSSMTRTTGPSVSFTR